jgi:phosphoglycerol transferase MdoB-like AlkP superfamily enzyme
MSIHTLFWFVLYGFFVDLLSTTSSSEVLYSFYLNFKFNLRLSFIALIPITLLSIFPKNIFNSIFFKKIAILYTLFLFIISFIVYITDIAYYLYLGNRIDASVFRFLDDFIISLNFIIQSYPIGWLSILIFIFLYLFYILSKRIFSNLVLANRGKLYKTISSFLVIIVIVLAIHGKISQYPLRWSEVFFSKDKDIATLSLNPILNLFDTFKYRKSNFVTIKDIDKKQKLLKENIVDNLFYETSTKPNIIIVMMESLNINRLGFVGNKLNPTPNLDNLIKDGYLFTEFFVPIRSTAQSVFTSIFGLPDVSRTRTASRNPFIKKQYSLINDLKGYEKNYFVGGSLSWANMRSLFTKFIPTMSLFEGEYHSNYPYSDVWGISDYNLFKEAHKKLEKISSKNKPFFAYIQTAGNHRPFTVPKENKKYKIKEFSDKKLKDNGFVSQDYFNGVNLLDFSVGEFIKNFKKSSYYENTIIVFFGDHGITSNEVPFIRKSDLELNIYENHVPLIIYAPSFIKQHKTFNRVSYLPDILPTILSMAKINFNNKTLGVDLLNINNKRQTAFLIGKGLVQDGFFLKKTNDKFKLYNLETNTAIEDDKRYNKMKNLFNAFKDVSQNMLY